MTEKFDPQEVIKWDRTGCDGDGKSLFNHLLIAAMTHLNKQDDDDLIKTWRAGKCEVSLKVNGIEMPVLEVCKEWDKQIDRMVGEEAMKLFEGKLHECMNELTELQDKVRRQMKEKLEQLLGIHLPEDEE